METQEIFCSKSITLRSDHEVNVSVWYGPNQPRNRNHTYKDVSHPSLKRAAAWCNTITLEPYRKHSVLTTVYIDGEFGVRSTLYVWTDELSPEPVKGSS